MYISLNAPATHNKPSETKTKNKNIHLRDLRMLFSNMDFNFAHFANFNFAHFETEESLGLI